MIDSANKTSSAAATHRSIAQVACALRSYQSHHG